MEGEWEGGRERQMERDKDRERGDRERERDNDIISNEIINEQVIAVK